MLTGDGSPRRDVIRINNLNLSLAVTTSRWSQTSTQPVVVTLSFERSLKDAAETDDLQRSIDYSTVHSALIRLAETRPEYPSLEALAEHILQTVFGICEAIQEATVNVVQMLSSPRASFGIQFSRFRSAVGTVPHGPYRIFLRGLVCNAIIGVNPSERVQKQPVRLNVSLEGTKSSTNDFDSTTWLSKIHGVRTHFFFLPRCFWISRRRHT